MQRTHPLRQPSAATSPNSMGEFAPLGKSSYFDFVKQNYMFFAG